MPTRRCPAGGDACERDVGTDEPVFDARISQDWPDAVVEATAAFRQGDVFPWPAGTAYVADSTLIIYGQADDESGDDTDEQFLVALDPPPAWAVITTQTCDLDEQLSPGRKPWFQYAPVLRTEDRGGSGLFAWSLNGDDLPTGEWYADLRFEGVAEKTILAGLTPVRGFASESDAIAFGRHLGHLRARPAFANRLVEAVTEHLRQFRKNSSEGIRKRTRREITEVRLDITDGSRLDPKAVRLVVLHGTTPTPETVDWFGKWFDAARPGALAVGIELHAVRHVNASGLDYHEIKDLAIIDISG